MKITEYELFEVPPRSLLLKIETDEGVVGWGEPTLEGRSQTVADEVENLMDTYVVGEEAFEIERLWEKMYRSGFYRGGPVLLSALSGIDQALWDIKGKTLDVPIYDLLGGAARDRIRLYAHFGGNTPDEMAESARRRVDEGFSAIKAGPRENWEPIDSPAAMNRFCEKIRATREAVGDEIDIMLDFHGRLSKAMAERLVVKLEEFDLMFVEELVVPEKNHTLPEIDRHTTIPIATGERMYTRWEFRSVLESGAVDVIQPDVSHAGGITEMRKIATMAETYDVAVAPHSPLSSVALAASIQIDACTPNALIQEQIVLNEDVPTYVKNMEVFELDDDGYISLPGEPGLGISIDEDAITEEATENDWTAPVVQHADGSIAEW